MDRQELSRYIATYLRRQHQCPSGKDVVLGVMTLKNTIVAMLATCCGAFWGACAADSGMSVSFDAFNTLRSIRVGEAEFATGGGHIWSATFAKEG